MTRPVFLADPDLMATAAPGGQLDLTGPEAHHAVAVRRITVEEEVDLVDGQGRRARCRVVRTAKDRLTLDVVDVTDEVAPVPRLVLVQALAKGGRDEQAVEQATELGVARVVPWQADRSVSRWDHKAARGRARWVATATAAAKQSRRAHLPGVDDVVDSRGLRDAVARAVTDGAVVLVLHERATDPVTAADLGVATDPSSSVPDAAEASTEVWVVVGPEGGISDPELDLLQTAGARPVLLGTHVLRSSTAGPAAIASLSVLLGHW